MIIRDETGRHVKVGQVVHIHIPTMVDGLITGIVEPPTLVVPGMSEPGYVDIVAKWRLPIREDGSCRFYIVQEPDKSIDNVRPLDKKSKTN